MIIRKTPEQIKARRRVRLANEARQRAKLYR